MTASFGDLRSLLQQQPTPHLFIRICKVVSELSAEHYLAEYEPYVLDYLASWPDETRVVPPQWTRRWDKWSGDPRLFMCRTLMNSGGNSLEELLCDYPEWLTHLIVRQQVLMGNIQMHRLPSLTHLTLRQVKFRQQFDTYAWPTLKFLHMEACILNGAPILESSTLETLICLNQEPPLHKWSVPYLSELQTVTISKADHQNGRPFYEAWARRGITIHVLEL